MGCFHYLRTGELCEFYKAEDLKRFPTVSEQGIMTTILDYSKKSAETSGVAISNASGTGAVPTMVGSSSTARFNVTTNLSAISSTPGRPPLPGATINAAGGAASSADQESFLQYMSKHDWVRYRLLFNPHETPLEDGLISEFVSR
jgi:hypothetical protein